MSAITGIGNSASPRDTTNAFGALSSDEFMKIIFSELQSQDPLEPSDTNALLEQLSTIRSIESDLSLSAKLETFVKQNEVSSASSLVGKFVAAKGQFGTDEVGFVDSVLLTNQGPMLNLSNGAQVAFDRVLEIIDPGIVGTTPEPEDEAESPVEPDPVAEPEPEPDPEEEKEESGGDPPGGA